jgi:hypothetical protein
MAPPKIHYSADDISALVQAKQINRRVWMTLWLTAIDLIDLQLVVKTSLEICSSWSSYISGVILDEMLTVGR